MPFRHCLDGAETTVKRLSDAAISAAVNWEKPKRQSEAAATESIETTSLAEVLAALLDGPLEHAPSFLSDKPLYSEVVQGPRHLILLIDDNKIQHRALRLILEPAGFSVTSCASAEEALAHLVREPALPDLIVTDLAMPPAMDGFDFLLRARSVWPDVRLPVIVCTSSNDVEDLLDKSLALGANDYIRKPARAKELVARVRMQIRMREAVRLEKDAEVLRTMLPKHVLNRIWKGEKNIGDAHDKVTVLFSDIVGFTPLSSKLPPKAIVQLVSEMFSAFDSCAEVNEVAKVDVIGDAYFCISGHTDPSDETQATRMIKQATEMLQVAQRLHIAGFPELEPGKVQIRIGIHTGPSHSGVIGVHCPRYTFFGDTVNVASRMESHGHPMSIHLSTATREQLLLEGFYSEEDFAEVNEREIKGKGMMTTYLLRVGSYEKALETWAKEAQRKAAAAAAAAKVESHLGPATPPPQLARLVGATKRRMSRRVASAACLMLVSETDSWEEDDMSFDSRRNSSSNGSSEQDSVPGRSASSRSDDGGPRLVPPRSGAVLSSLLR